MTLATLTAAQIKLGNKMNRFGVSAQLGTRLAAGEAAIATLQTGTVVISGSYSVANADVTASAVVLAPGMAAVKGEIVQILRSGSPITTYANVSASGSKITLTTSGSSNVFIAGDIVNYLAF
jgi:hypothetical protein